MFVALGGGLAGLIVSFVSAQIVAATFGPSFFKELGGAIGVLLVIAGVSVVMCRLLAHVPPRIDGQELNLEVEFRFPNGNTNAPPTAEGEWRMELDPRVTINRRKILQHRLNLFRVCALRKRPVDCPYESASVHRARQTVGSVVQVVFAGRSRVSTAFTATSRKGL